MSEKSLNKVMLIGRLGKDPEVKYITSGQAVANFSVATSESWQDKDGQNKDRTEWHRIVIFGKLAEIAGQYLNKGSRVYLEGRLQTREWEKDGQKRSTTEIVVRDMVMLSPKGESAGGGGGPAAEPELVEDPGAHEDVPF